MISDHLKQRRLLVPRWRSLSVTLGAKELASPVLSEAEGAGHATSREFEEKALRWRLEPGVITGGELVGAALVEGHEERALAAARFISSHDSTATEALKRLAKSMLTKAHSSTAGETSPWAGPSQSKSLWRGRVRMYPANALAWVELSLCDLVIGKKHRAKRAMLVALQLAPTNRHVLRSACRLFLNLGDPERAYDVIRRSAATINDPWLMAAELSVAELADQRPKYLKHGRRIVADGGLMPRQITELAGAIATLEMTGGHAKKARDYFHRSVLDPTGSALAQAEWASAELGVEFVSSQQLTQATERDEAEVFHLLREEKFADVPEVCMRWSESEPYAIRPFEIASSATSMVGQYRQTMDLAIKGLKIRPKGTVLLNNYAFALIHLGEFTKAETVLQAIGLENQRVWLVGEANRGLLAMRRGQVTTGLRHYGSAIGGIYQIGGKEII